MKETNIHTDLLRALAEYEHLGELIPSAGWNDALMHRIEHVRPTPKAAGAGTVFLLAALLLVLLNIGSIFQVLHAGTAMTSNRDNALETISNALLSHPISYKE